MLIYGWDVPPVGKGDAFPLNNSSSPCVYSEAIDSSQGCTMISVQQIILTK